jgi:hypothetical protein
MDSHTEILPVGTATVGKASLKQRLSIICYLSAVAVATVGWLSALGWAALSVAKWLIA